MTAAADVYSMADDQVADLVDAGALQDIGKVDAALAEDVKTRNTAGSVAAASVDGELYAFPATASNGFYLNYDSSVLAKEDIGSYETMLSTLKTKSDTAGVTYKYAFQFNSGWYLDGWFRAAGLIADKAVTEDNKVYTKCDRNTAKGIEVAKAIMTLTQGEYKNYFTSTDDATMRSDAGRDSGDYRIVAGCNGTWAKDDFITARGEENFAATKLPTFKLGDEDLQERSVAGFKLFGVNKYSKQVGWAVKLADFLTTEGPQISRVSAMGDGPSNIEAAEDESVQDNVALSGLAEQSAYGDVQKVSQNYRTPTQSLAAALYAGTNGDTDLITSGRGTANLVFDDDAIQTLLDEAVAAIEAVVE
jgi:arabinogalactan oligomer/maltooligosaccharide transport system substrate-binding protein